jgi:hypothetical protein
MPNLLPNSVYTFSKHNKSNDGKAMSNDETKPNSHQRWIPHISFYIYYKKQRNLAKMHAGRQSIMNGSDSKT